MNPRTRRLLSLLFFLSGFCGLCYQLVWLRLAFARFGIVTPVLSVVVSVFMLGIALGSVFGGRWARALHARLGIAPILAYGIAEIGIGAGALLVPPLFGLKAQALLSVGATDSAAYLLLSALCIGAALLPWCVLMGTTYPFMMSFLKERAPEDEEGFSHLYVANVVGAMAGVLCTAGFLIEVMGFRQTLFLGAVLNGVVAALAIFVVPKAAAEDPAGGGGPAPRPAPRWAGEPTRFRRPLLFMTGFTSMAMEVVWTRSFGLVLGNEVYSFAALLFVYLLATAVGSAAYRADLARGRVRSTAALLALLAVAAFLPIVLNDVRWGHEIDTGAAVALASIAPFCALLGYLTPRLVDEDGRGAPDLAGRAYAWNVLGCILGPLVAGYLLLPALGAPGSLVVLAVPYVAFLAADHGALGRARAALAGTAALALAAFGATLHVDYEDPFFPEEREARVVRRDHTATVISYGQGDGRMLMVNGRALTSLTQITHVMAHMPLVVRGEAERALSICFGMGTTHRALLTHGIEATAVELVPSVVEAFPWYHADAAEVLADPKGAIVVDDGRRFLLRTDQVFDVVTIDPPPPIQAAGSGLLYSTEFYEAAKRRMAEGAILQQWFPSGPGLTLKAVARSLVESFPHVRAYHSIDGWGVHFLASMQPFQSPTRAQIEARMPPRARRDLEERSRSGDAVADLVEAFRREIPLRELLADEKSIRITDDQPMNEYYWLRTVLGGG